MDNEQMDAYLLVTGAKCYEENAGESEVRKECFRAIRDE